MQEQKKLLVFFGLGFTILTILLYLIFKPLLNTILLGFIFSFLMYPLYKIINKKLKSQKFSSFLVCLIFILVITTPLIFGVNSLAQEIFSVGKTISNSDILSSLENFECNGDNFLCNSINDFLVEANLTDTLKDFVRENISKVSNYVGNLLLKLPSLILNIFMIIFMMYYLLMDGKKFVQKVYSIIPISSSHKYKLFKKTFDVLGGILFGNITVAVIQGILAGVGFAIFGVKAPLLWGIVTIFFALIPMLGAGIVWFPASIYLIITSVATSNIPGVWQGVGLMIYGAIIVSTLDNFIRPMLVSDKTNIHPVLVLFGVIGGLSVFGAAGIFIGPLILGMFLTLIEMFEDEKDFMFNSDNNSNNISNNYNNKKNKSNKISKNNMINSKKEKMPEGLSCIMTKKDYSLLQEYKKNLNLKLNDYFKKLNIPIIKYSSSNIEIKSAKRKSTKENKTKKSLKEKTKKRTKSKK